MALTLGLNESFNQYPQTLLAGGILTLSGGRIVARFWAYSKDVDTESYEVFGLTPVPPDPKAANRLSELNVPDLLRREYDNWCLAYL